MIKDRGQKKLAVRYCAVQGILPFAEVIVRSFLSVDDAPLDITDLDVVGLEVGRFGRVRRIFFDCKTANKQGGINRALWASGVRHLVEAEAGFVIQLKSVPDTHRLAAMAMGIYIHSEETFRRYASSVNPAFAKDITYLDDMDRWDELLNAGRRHPALADLIFFVSTQAALELSGPKGIRLGLSAIMRASGELDPTKKLDQMIFLSSLSTFLLHLAMSVSVFKDAFDFSMHRNDFEKRLRYFLWEGRDNYELRFKLRRALSERVGAKTDTASEFDLPEWSKLVELIRGYLEAPDALASLPIIVKEIAFRCTSPSSKPDAEDRLVTLLASSKRARQFIFSAAAYFVQAGSLPLAFQSELESHINNIIS